MTIDPHTTMSLRLAAAALAAGALLAPVWAQAADLGGVWWIKDRSEKAAVKADSLPFTPAGAAAYKASQAALAAGKSVPIGQLPCLPYGAPRMMLSRLPMQILQRPEQVTFLLEAQHMVRLVYMGKAINPEDEPAYNGYSVGRWDGEVLVVETGNTKGETVVDATGIPQSDATKVVERFSLQDGGKTLRDTVTVEDAKMFTAPWTFTIDFDRRADVRLMEDVCTFGPPQRDRLGPSK